MDSPKVSVIIEKISFPVKCPSIFSCRYGWNGVDGSWNLNIMEYRYHSQLKFPQIVHLSAVAAEMESGTSFLLS